MIKEIYGKKIGMTQVFDEQGDLIPITLVEVEPVYVLELVKYPTQTKAKIGCFKIKGKRIDKIKRPIKGFFDKLEVSPYKLIREVNMIQDASLSLESEPKGELKDELKSELKDDKPAADPRQVGVELFEPGEIIDVRAKTKGRGFAGGMKRHGWGGQPSSHGHTMHRRLGSAGASAYPSRIIKGLGMPGHMGNNFCTVKNLKVLKIDKDKDLIFIHGNIPGHRGAIIRLKKIK